MSVSSLAVILLLLTAVGYHLGTRRATSVAGGRGKTRVLHSRPTYYGAYVGLWCGLPALVLTLGWLAGQDAALTSIVIANLPLPVQNLPASDMSLLINDVKNLVVGNISSDAASDTVIAAANHYEALASNAKAALTVLAIALGVGGLALGLRAVKPSLRARNAVERVIIILLIFSSTIAIFTTLGIVLSVLFEAYRFFEAVPPTDFLFGTTWSPQTAIRADQVGASGSFGAVPLFVGTLLISAIAMVVAVPTGLLSAIYLSEYAAPRVRAVVKPLLEILAGIPTVVYGFFAALTVAPVIRHLGQSIGLEVASESALAAGLVMGIMIIPFVSSLSDDVLNAVPQSLRDGAYGLGATHSETIRQVVIPAALPGIVSGILLAASRAIGETMIVVMAAGLAGNLTVNPLSAVTTVTAQIVTLLVGDQEFDSPKTLAAFALGLMLFLTTLVLNVVALYVVRRYREQYE
ncbi:MAG: phosphate transport system permease protein [Gammaproteobacteria bacterium]|jgi:phosphate transport system permease protein